MQMLMNKGRCLLVSYFLFAPLCVMSSHGFGQNTKSEIAIESDLAIGFGQFQDIQIPTHASGQLRGDGRTIGPENVAHSGFPVAAQLGVKYGSIWQSLGARFEAIHMDTVNAPKETADSSYNRLSGALQYRKMWKRAGVKPIVKAELEYRRNMFRNVSTGHYMEAVMPRLGIGARINRGFSVEVDAGYGWNPRFGYDNGRASQDFQSVSAGLMDGSVATVFHLDRETSIAIGAEAEQAQVQLSNIEEYNGFGLNVSSFQPVVKTYELSTFVGFLRLSKLW